MRSSERLDPKRAQLTDLLRDWASGDDGALSELTPRVYDRMRRLAAAFLRQERADHTLQTEALVHEAFLRLIEQPTVRYENREQFFANVGRMMRRILVDHARAKSVQKRGRGVQHVPEEALDFEVVERPLDLVALDDALEALEAESPDLAKVVELKFFVGLTIGEIAEITGLGTATVQRRWTLARAELYERMSDGAPAGGRS